MDGAMVRPLQRVTPVVEVVFGQLQLQTALQVQVVHLSKVVIPTGIALMGLPKQLVAEVVQAEQVLRRCITTAVQVELELQVP